MSALQGQLGSQELRSTGPAGVEFTPKVLSVKGTSDKARAEAELLGRRALRLAEPVLTPREGWGLGCMIFGGQERFFPLLLGPPSGTLARSP